MKNWEGADFTASITGLHWQAQDLSDGGGQPQSGAQTYYLATLSESHMKIKIKRGPSRRVSCDCPKFTTELNVKRNTG